jgi:hypothetical protein
MNRADDKSKLDKRHSMMKPSLMLKAQRLNENRALQVAILENGKWMGRNPMLRIDHYETIEEHNFLSCTLRREYL